MTLEGRAKLYLVAVGGWGADFKRLHRVDALDISSPAGRWLPLPPLGVARCGAAVCVSSDGRVLAAGGSGEASAEMLRADLSGWDPLPPMGVERCGGAAVRLADGRLMVIGGSRLGGRRLLPSAEAIVPVSTGSGTTAGVWAQLAPMQSARVNFGADVISGSGGREQVVVAGGELSAGNSATAIAQSVEIYEVADNTWSALASPLSVQRFGCGAVTVGKTLSLVFGGFGGRSSQSDEQQQAASVTVGSAISRPGGFTGLRQSPRKVGLPPPPPPPSGAAAAAATPSSADAKVSQSLAEMAQFLSADVTSLLQPKLLGLPRMMDKQGCPCCVEEDGPDPAKARGRPLHSAELYDPAL